MDRFKKSFTPSNKSKGVQVKFYRVKLVNDPDNAKIKILIRWNTDTAVYLDDEQTKIVSLFIDGKTIGEVVALTSYTVSQVYQVLLILTRHGFVKSIGDHSYKDSEQKISPWFKSVSKEKLALLVSKPFVFISSFLILTSGVLYLNHRNLFPRFEDFFWSSDILLNLLVINLLTLLFTCTHELGHFLCTKAVGGQAKISVSNRFIFLVFQTEHYHLSVLTKTQRYMIYIAGIFVDVLITAIILWFLYATYVLNINIGVWEAIFKLAILIQMLHLSWQFNAFIQTDIYNLISESIGQDNILLNSQKMFVKRVERWKSHVFQPLKRILLRLINTKELREQSDDLRYFTPKEKRLTQMYMFYWLLGILFSFGVFVVITLPRDFIFLVSGLTSLTIAVSSVDIVGIIRAILTIILVVYAYILLVTIIISKRKKGQSIL